MTVRPIGRRDAKRLETGPKTGIRDTDAGEYPPELRWRRPIVATGEESLPDLLDPLQSEHAVGGRVLLLVDVAELVEMTFKGRM